MPTEKFYILHTALGSIGIKSLNSWKWNCEMCILQGNLLLPQFQYLHFSRCHVLPTVKYGHLTKWGAQIEITNIKCIQSEHTEYSLLQ